MKTVIRVLKNSQTGEEIQGGTLAHSFCIPVYFPILFQIPNEEEMERLPESEKVDVVAEYFERIPITISPEEAKKLDEAMVFDGVMKVLPKNITLHPIESSLQRALEGEHQRQLLVNLQSN